MKNTFCNTAIIVLIMVFGMSFLYSQSGISDKYFFQNPNKVVKLKTTVTPRKSEVVFVGKAMEVIITPLDEFGNEIKEIQTGLNAHLSISDAIKEHDQVGKKIIYGKTYLYLTPLKPHNILNGDVLKVGAFLTDSISGLPNLSSGAFVDVLVADHVPLPPDVGSFTIYSEKTKNFIKNDQIIICEGQRNDSYLFGWGKASDTNSLPLRKSNFPDDTLQWIQDQCHVKYTLKVKEYQNYPFANLSDTANWLRITSKEFNDIYKFLRVGTAKSCFVNYFVICEDEVYKYSIPEFSDKITTSSKKIEIVELSPGAVDENDRLTNTYYLSQNYPNPFNPGTTIKVGLPKADNLNVSIYNVFGQKVKTLINKKESPGFKDLYWDGKDEKGIPVSSGTYIYTITSGDFVQVKKMHLIK